MTDMARDDIAREISHKNNIYLKCIYFNILFINGVPDGLLWA